MTEAELYAQEDAEIVANDERLTAARTPFSSSGIPATVAPAEVAALAAAVDAEQAALVARTVLHTRINAARAARKDPRQ